MCIDPFFFRGWEFTSHGASTGCIFYTRVEDGRRNSIPVSSSWWPPPVNLYIIHTIHHNTVIYIFFGPLTSLLHPHILLFCPWTWILKFACLFCFSWTIFILTVQFMLKCPWSATHSLGGVWCHWLWLSEHEILHLSFLFVWSTLCLWFCVFSYIIFYLF